MLTLDPSLRFVKLVVQSEFPQRATGFFKLLLRYTAIRCNFNFDGELEPVACRKL